VVGYRVPTGMGDRGEQHRRGHQRRHELRFCASVGMAGTIARRWFGLGA
jgi:hypothetical protein